MNTFAVAGFKDLSEPMLDLKRALYHVVFRGEPGEKKMLDFAKRIVGKHIAEHDTQAVGFFFWSPDQQIGHEPAKFAVDWAPYGKWECAGDFPAGQYENHEYKFVPTIGSIMPNLGIIIPDSGRNGGTGGI